MKINILDTNLINQGSRRIFCNYLAKLLNKIENCVCEINNNDNSKFDIIIFAKNKLDQANKFKNKNPNKIVGGINIASDVKNNLDFIIVGSIEEKISLLPKCSNIFIFPLVETLFTKSKKHIPKKVITLGYHGNHHHLSSFYPNITTAIEKFSKKQPIELLIISNGNKWKIGRPKNIKIREYTWNIDTIEDLLLQIDIGLVPNNSYIDQKDYFLSEISKKKKNNIDCYNTDFLLRMKNKSNAGRCFVFHQLNIPVIADLVPSNFHILGNPDNGYIASNMESWLHGLHELKDNQKREEVANNAKKKFEEEYDMNKWTYKIYLGLKKLLKE